jgi:uncharacterized protein (DUF169 family)
MHVLVDAQNPCGNVEIHEPTIRRDWSALTRFVNGHRQQEKAYVTRNSARCASGSAIRGLGNSPISIGTRGRLSRISERHDTLKVSNHLEKLGISCVP